MTCSFMDPQVVIELSNIYTRFEILIAVRPSARNIVDGGKNFYLDSRRCEICSSKKVWKDWKRKSGRYPAGEIIETAARLRRLYQLVGGRPPAKLASDRVRNPNRDVAISPTTMASRDKWTRDAVRKVGCQKAVAEPATIRRLESHRN